MTYKELIMYILSNNLENSQVCKNGKLTGFMTVNEAAVKFKVGVATITVWIDRGQLTAINIGSDWYIPDNAQNPLERRTSEKTNEIRISSNGRTASSNSTKYDVSGKCCGSIGPRGF